VNKRKRVNGPALCERQAHLSSAEPSSIGNGPWPRVSASACDDVMVARSTTSTCRPRVPRSPSPLSSRTSLKARYFLLSLAKLSPSPSHSVTTLHPLSAVHPRHQLLLMNRINHCPRTPQSHANVATTPSHRPTSSHRRVPQSVPLATSSTVTSSMTASSSHCMGPPRC
jgi:hypothetical protein